MYQHLIVSTTHSRGRPFSHISYCGGHDSMFGTRRGTHCGLMRYFSKIKIQSVIIFTFSLLFCHYFASMAINVINCDKLADETKRLNLLSKIISYI